MAQHAKAPQSKYRPSKFFLLPEHEPDLSGDIPHDEETYTQDCQTIDTDRPYKQITIQIEMFVRQVNKSLYIRK
jgi:hypothetical protein